MRRYKGFVYGRCTQVGLGQCDGKGWHVVTYHHVTGLPMSEELRPFYRTERLVKEAIDAGELNVTV